MYDSDLIFTDDEIRECVFLSLDERFDPHLAQAESLTTLFVAMHDGVSLLPIADYVLLVMARQSSSCMLYLHCMWESLHCTVD